jgi:hypothetical protein
MLDAVMVDAVILSCVRAVSDQSGNIGRVAALTAGCPVSAPETTGAPRDRCGVPSATEVALEATGGNAQKWKAFGTTISSFQNTKFELAACSIDVAAGRALLDDGLRGLKAGTSPLSIPRRSRCSASSCRRE